jgi:hypothetical protein
MMKEKFGALLLTKVVGRNLLAGRAQGEVDAPRIQRATRDIALQGRVLLDLTGIELVSASYFDVALWPLWSPRAELFPMLAKVKADALDEIGFVLKAHAAAIWHLPEDADSPVLIGSLDAPLKKALDFVTQRSGSTAAELAETDTSVVATAMNNRLASLFEMRLVTRRKEGRRLVYLPVWEES